MFQPGLKPLNKPLNKVLKSCSHEQFLCDNLSVTNTIARVDDTAHIFCFTLKLAFYSVI